MRILVYGAGVLGCNLARDFFKAGKDVTLLARGKWAETIKTNGLCIKNYVLPVKSTVRVPVVSELASEDEYDVIFVAARYTQVATILDALRANKSKNVVFLGNNVQPEKLVTALPEKNVMFAFASSIAFFASSSMLMDSASLMIFSTSERFASSTFGSSAFASVSGAFVSSPFAASV